MHNLDFVKLQVILMLMNAYVNGLYNQSYILCTNLSSWRDAMETCILEGGRPLTHDDIKMTNLSEKIDLTVWTAEHTALSNQRWNSSKGHDLLRDTVCGSQTVHREKSGFGSVIESGTDIQYKNCTEQQAYVCDGGQDQKHMHPKVHLNETTWMNAEASCKSQNRGLFTFSQLPVTLELLGPIKVDVWIGLLASLDRRNRIEEGQVHRVDIVKCGTFSNSAGFRMIDEYLPNQFAALCDFESLMPVRQSLFTDCVKGKENTNLHAADSYDSTISYMPWLAFAVTISGSVLFVLTCGGVVICIYIFDKKKKRRTRSFAKTGTTDSTNIPEFPMNVDTSSVVDDHGQVDDHHMASEQPFPERQSAIDSLNVNKLTFAVGQNRTIQQIADNDFDGPMYNT